MLSGINYIIPTYISSLGPYSDNSTDLGKINKDYLDILEIVCRTCCWFMFSP